MPLTVMFAPPPAGTAITVYWLMGVAPLLTGAVKLTRPVEETATVVGASGAVFAVKTTGVETEEVPLRF